MCPSVAHSSGKEDAYKEDAAQKINMQYLLLWQLLVRGRHKSCRKGTNHPPFREKTEIRLWPENEDSFSWPFLVITYGHHRRIRDSLSAAGACVILFSPSISSPRDREVGFYFLPFRQISFLVSSHRPPPLIVCSMRCVSQVQRTLVWKRSANSITHCVPSSYM